MEEQYFDIPMHAEPDLPPKERKHGGLFTKIITVQFGAVIVLLILLASIRLFSYGTYEKIAEIYKASFFTTYDFTEKCEDVFKSINEFFQKDDIEPTFSEPNSSDSSTPEDPHESTTDETEPLETSSESFA
jgi:hypothetical protein